MAHAFEKISKEGRAEGLLPGTREARDWYRDRAMSIGSVDPQSLMKDRNKLKRSITPIDIGRMYLFFYDPKWKQKLPFYDRFPMTFIVDIYSDGFLGLNLHYLPPIYRARLMDALYTISRKDNQKKSTKLRMSYNLMKTASKYKYFRPCIKRYLNSHIRSRFLYVSSDDWDIALMLPLERFKKARKNTVWQESKTLIRRG